ncbi:kinesin-like protein KIN-4C isoform X3 [Punica granatum]|uniref:Kinesin-like protein KIN-4C isoform X3 n=1 Tax=Punica granatum TaxID=22663 RepID=A0A6P8C156_PUNGR|nr:kinesin-like protein KIN-4C isoform X3 [Punica granatum]
MENSNGAAPHDRDSSQCVRVAVNIRPLITPELLNGCTDCITVIPGEPQVQIGSHVFTYDYVYGNKGSPSSSIFDDCVAPLVEALFHGYNATVLAYGQTGSGKTYTMGTNYNGEESSGRIIPKVMEMIFRHVETMKDSTEFLIRVSFIEIFKEEVFDLLDSSSSISKGEGMSSAKTVGAARVPIQIRETVMGGITLAGVTEAEVRSKEEMSSYLLRGSLSRATGSTNMNSQSSRSHAIFTITVEQKKNLGESHNDVGDDILCSKLHLVDLAGSERAKRTGADGMRLKEGIHINKGLLALGNVISALGDDRKRKEGAHIPYRDSKLTRLLQDSLGGNSKTVMIACVSPADTNAEETLNTLKYANRARNIQNKAIVNRDPMADQLQRMRSQIEQLQAELLFYRGDTNAPFEELQLLKHKISLLEASNVELQKELQERQVSCEHLMQRAIDAQVEKDKLIMQIESARNGKSWDEIEIHSEKEYDLIKNYVSKIQELEGELLRLQNLHHSKHRVTEWTDSEDDGLNVKNESFTCLNEKQKSDEAARRLQDEIHRIKSQKVQLQHKIKQESESFRAWKAAREKEVLQLKKEGRRNEYEMHKLLALNQRQKMVLQRKTEEASMATKRLKELLESRKASSRETGGSGPGLQALMQAIEHELEVTVRVHEVRSAYERQMEERARMGREIARLKEEVEMQKQVIMRNSNYPQGMSPGARNSRIFALENMLSTSSSALVSMASQLSEAEERERGFSGRGRWNQVRSLAEAKSLMNHLFNMASSSRCQLRDREVDCREKDAEIQDLKEKVVKLTSIIRQMEMQKAELVQQVKSQNMLLMKHLQDKAADSGGSDTSSGGHNYGLRKQQEPRNSVFVLEDMDTSESEASDCDIPDDDDDCDWGAKCCSCSKQSRCKTSKCECRSTSTICGAGCGCLPTLCSNRETAAVDAPETTDQNKEDNSEKSSELVSEGAALLQSAFGEKLAALNEDGDNGSKRKALSDIGNRQVTPNAPKPNQRKKWGKAVVQLVPVAPPAASQLETTAAAAVKKPEEFTIEGDLPLKLPRAMRTPAANSGSSSPLREKNSDPSNGPTHSKENAPHAPRSPPRRVPTSDEKENLSQ